MVFAFAAGFGIATLLGYALHASALPKLKPAMAPSGGKEAAFDAWSLLETGGIPVVNEKTDLALMNLRCCPPIGKPGYETAAMLATLDEWTQRISMETFRNLHRYRENPGKHGSEAEWRMAMMCTVLGQDLGVKYDPNLTAGNIQHSSNSVFFADPSKVFLQGLLGPERTGTCSSLPVLHVVLGRRLGYPMHLVLAKGHLFARWDDGKGTRINLESSSAGGFVSHPDDHYRTWPYPLFPDEEETGGYLRNLSIQECLAVFLQIRSACHGAKSERPKAILAASQALSLAPQLGDCEFTLYSVVESDLDLPPSPQHQTESHLPKLPLDPEPRAPMFNPQPLQPFPIPNSPSR